MPITEDAEATLLLTAYLSRQDGEVAKPLTAREWSRLVQWLTREQLTPSALLSDDIGKHLDCWTDKEATRNRIEALLHRKVALGMGLEKWERSGLWVMTRSDEDYPRRLKQKLAVDSPPVLFGCGNRDLLVDGSLGIAVVGSRKTTSENIAYSRDVGRLAAENGWSVVSGGASGVDAAAMLGALEAEGRAVGVLADGLLKAATSAKYRPYLMKNDLTLISPFYPEAGFNVGNAMNRNKLIYCLSRFALVVHAEIDRGGTWAGAIENLEHGWTPLWVKKDRESRGNLAIAGQIDARSVESMEVLKDLFAKNGADGADVSIYEVFLEKARQFCSEVPKTFGEIHEYFESDKIGKRQLTTWLNMAMKSGKIGSVADSERYRWIADEQLPMAERGRVPVEDVQAPTKSSVVQQPLSDVPALASSLGHEPEPTDHAAAR